MTLILQKAIENWQKNKGKRWKQVEVFFKKPEQEEVYIEIPLLEEEEAQKQDEQDSTK